MGKITHIVYGIKWVNTDEGVKLPETASERMMSSRD
jgi:hypothetical protein